MKTRKTGKFEMPAGKYWLGDPCYIYPENRWSEFCDSLETTVEIPNGIASGDNCPFITKEGIFVNDTEYGDGYYPVLKNNRNIGNLGVDAGLLSLVPLKLAETFDKYYNKRPHGTSKDLGIILDMPKNFTVEVDGGNFSFEDYDVITSDFYEDETA